jgi:hypothetical protein
MTGKKNFAVIVKEASAQRSKSDDLPSLTLRPGLLRWRSQ